MILGRIFHTFDYTFYTDGWVVAKACENVLRWDEMFLVCNKCVFYTKWIDVLMINGYYEKNKSVDKLAYRI